MPVTQNAAIVLFEIAFGNLQKKTHPGRASVQGLHTQLHRLESGVTCGQQLGVRSSDYTGDNSDTQFSEKGTESTHSLLTT